MNTRVQTTETEIDIPFQLHPRVFSALGADLVTNDIVAVIELVKNSYDAMASCVWIRFDSDPKKGDYLEVEDDGIGMSETTLKDVWCVVATPYRERYPVSKSGSKERRSSGSKGLGRLSAARLGHYLAMVTKTASTPCYELTVDWDSFSSKSTIGSCSAKYRRCPTPATFGSSGTRIRIYGLRSLWNEDEIDDLQENLARLVPPFPSADKFEIYVQKPGMESGEAVEIEPPAFLARPKYRIKGRVDAAGWIRCKYSFAPFTEAPPREKSLTQTWEQTIDNLLKKEAQSLNPDSPGCGPFSFEIRTWDIDAEGTEEIADLFKDFSKSEIRKSIRAHKGVSVYRDNILVLPKSETARDWLGLDLRRVSRTGTRLSTNQIVGYVSIRADRNPQIKDTSDRERLVSGPEVKAFEALLKAIVGLLEIERDSDRVKTKKFEPLVSLFESITAQETVDAAQDLINEGGQAHEVIPLLHDLQSSLDVARKEIEERFVYYSRMAVVGSIAERLVHEIRNRTTSVGKFLSSVYEEYSPFEDDELERAHTLASSSIDHLEQFADRFAPLANRNFRRGKRSSVVEKVIRDSIELCAGELKRAKVIAVPPTGETTVAADPGELEAVLINLIMNSAYWLKQVPVEDRKIEFKLRQGYKDGRLQIWVHDTGPGVDEADAERIFLPGVTKRPGGIGMGLTIASELVANYEGTMGCKIPGSKGGASFFFDLPLKK